MKPLTLSNGLLVSQAEKPGLATHCKSWRWIPPGKASRSHAARCSAAQRPTHDRRNRASLVYGRGVAASRGSHHLGICRTAIARGRARATPGSTRRSCSRRRRSNPCQSFHRACSVRRGTGGARRPTASSARRRADRTDLWRRAPAVAPHSRRPQRSRRLAPPRRLRLLHQRKSCPACRSRSSFCGWPACHEQQALSSTSRMGQIPLDHLRAGDRTTDRRIRTHCEMTVFHHGQPRGLSDTVVCAAHRRRTAGRASQIRAMDLNSGARLWSHPIRDTVDRRPRPP